MKVSFIIPIYNCEIYIENLVKKILTIDIEDFEIILVDDGSVDNSAAVCDDLARKYGCIKVIHQKNAGASAARNTGIKNANGEYILFFDVDDDIDPIKLRHVLKIMFHGKNMDLLIYGNSFDYFKNGKCYRKDRLCYEKEGLLDQREWCSNYYQLFMNNSLSPVWNKIFKRDLIEKNQLRFSENMFLYEDLEFVIRYMAFCQNIYNCTEIIYHYRQPEDEANAKRRVKKIDNLEAFVGQIEETLDKMISELEIVDENIRLNMKTILARLFFTIVKEKIDVSTVQEIKKTCNEMQDWYDEHSELFIREFSDKEKKFINKLLNKKVVWLILNRAKIRIRHKIAVKVKSTILYQKLRG